MSIFRCAPVLTCALAAIGAAAFYLVFSIYANLRAAEKRASRRLLRGCARDLGLLRVLASGAPMVGLLGTVVGIGLCIDASDDEAALAAGISYALRTTQTGLIMAIPAWIASILLAARLRKLDSLLGERAG